MNLKRLFLLLCFAGYHAGENHAVQNAAEFVTVPAVATASDVFTLDDGQEIRIYNDRLQVGETYIVKLDLINDSEPVDYKDLETFELDKNLFS